MKILVCIKQICLSGVDFQNGDRWITTKSNAKYGISRFDEYALEAAIQIKEAYNAAIDGAGEGGVDPLLTSRATVDVLSMGPQRVTESIRRAIGMGADHGIHLMMDRADQDVHSGPENLEASNGGDALDASCSGYVPGRVTAKLIADFLASPPPKFLEYIQYTETEPGQKNNSGKRSWSDTKSAAPEHENGIHFHGKRARGGQKIPYDLIFTGIMSEDLMQAQVGPTLAEHLEIDCITSVVKIDPPWGALENSEDERCEMGDRGALSPGIELHSLHEDPLTIHRELEGGQRQKVSVKSPVLLTIQAGINHPRYPSFSNLFKAKQKGHFTVEIDTLFSYSGVAEPPPCPFTVEMDTLFHQPPGMAQRPVVSGGAVASSAVSDPGCRFWLEHPRKKREGKVLSGAINEQTDMLMEILKERGII